MRLFTLLLAAGILMADGPGVIVSKRSKSDFALTADPASKAWKKVPGVFAENDSLGRPVANHRTEIRSRWTDRNLYLLFVCPYEQLNLKPNPSQTTETNQLWNWDVAETFIGSDFENIRHYKELQVSPQGEWVDLDIERGNRKSAGWRWNSGYEVKARLDEAHKIWYGEMRIPFSSIDARAPKAGNQLRINFYRLQGPGRMHRMIAWQPTGQLTYHVPESFGRMRLDK